MNDDGVSSYKYNSVSRPPIVMLDVLFVVVLVFMVSHLQLKSNAKIRRETILFALVEQSSGVQPIRQ